VALSFPNRGKAAKRCGVGHFFKSNTPSPIILNIPSVLRPMWFRAGEEWYSSSKTYLNTLLVLFKGFGFAPPQ
jgi:hypothetical protein